MKGESEIKKLAEEFVACKDILMAVGDENRLHLMIEMMQMGNCSGVWGTLRKRHICQDRRCPIISRS